MCTLPLGSSREFMGSSREFMGSSREFMGDEYELLHAISCFIQNIQKVKEMLQSIQKVQEILKKCTREFAVNLFAVNLQ